jgi:hypothetical protein
MKIQEIFILLSVLSFSFFLYSQYLLTTEFARITRAIVPLIFCYKDETYMLSEETSPVFCRNINRLRALDDIDCDFLYEDYSEKKACESLKQGLVAREDDCFNMFFGKKTTSVTELEVEKNCEILVKAIK